MANKPTENQKVILDLLASCKPHQWLCVMRWAVKKMAEQDQMLLIAAVLEEASRRSLRGAESVAAVLNDLGLRLVAVD